MRHLVAAMSIVIFAGCVSCSQIDPCTQEEYRYLEWAWDDADDARCRDIVALTERWVWHFRENVGTNKFHTIVISVRDGTNTIRSARYKIRGAKKE